MTGASPVWGHGQLEDGHGPFEEGRVRISEWILSASALVLCLGGAAAAVVGDDDQGAPRLLQVALLDGDSVKAKIRTAEGGRIEIALEASQPLFLTPYLRDGRLELVVNAVVRENGTPTLGAELARYSVDEGVWTAIDELPESIRVQWTDLGTGAQVLTTEPAGPCLQCCVVCGGDSFCGCAVETPCGSCCCPTVCGCPGSAVQAGPSCPATRTNTGRN